MPPSTKPGGRRGNHGGCGERSGGARRERRGQLWARSPLLRRPPPGARPVRRASSVVAALAALTVTPTDSYGGRTCRLASLPGPAAQAPGILPSLSALAAIPRRREPASTLRVVGGRRRRRAGGPRRTGGHARGRRGRGRPREEVPTALGPVANRGRLGQLRGIWLANAIT